MQKMFFSLTKISWSNFKKERERYKVPVFMYAFMDVLLEGEREPLKLLISPLNVVFNSCVSQCQQDMGKAGTNYQHLAVQKGAQGPAMLHVFLSFLGCIIIYSL